MIDRFKQCFQTTRREKRAALVSFFTYGYPSKKESKKLIKRIADESDILEIGLPFSDPTADGPVIQKASFKALSEKVKVKESLEFVKELRNSFQGPVVLMTYLNPVFRYGVERFLKDAFSYGADGIIIPDMPVEEIKILGSGKNNLKTILMVAPTTSPQRIHQIAKKSRGFVYLVSTLGVTGERESINKSLIGFIKKTKALTRLPVCVGFGISSPEQVAFLSKYADGIIVGSAIINRVVEGRPLRDNLESITIFLRSLKAATKYG